jgi:hypothetical protein
MWRWSDSQNDTDPQYDAETLSAVKGFWALWDSIYDCVCLLL